MIRATVYRRADLAALLLAVLAGGCHGGLHRRGENQVALTGAYHYPIKGEAIWPDGEGRSENTGVAVEYRRFVRDRFAVGGAITPYRNYNQSDGDVYAGEFQINLRYYFAEFELGGVPVGLFADIWGGMLQGARSVPEDGSHTNFTQDTGLGIELKLSKNVSWLTGYHLRHLSNGRIFGGENPSQNDHMVFTGLAIGW